MSLFLSVCWACGSSTGRLSARLNHRHLSFVALELWEPLPQERQRSCRCTGSVATLRSSARLNRAHLPFITTCTSTTSSMNDSSTIFWISWKVGTVSAQRDGSQQSSGSSSVSVLSVAQLECSTLSNCPNLNLKHLYCLLLDSFT